MIPIKETYSQIRKKILKRDKRRTITLVVCCILIFVFFFVRTFELQVATAERYTEQAKGITTITAPIHAARGEILDYYGRPIATNREGYNIVFNYAGINKTTLNDTVLSLIKLLGNGKWQDDLPISLTAPFEYTAETDSTEVTRLLSILNIAHYATAENCFDEMVKRYSLEDRDPTVQRYIMGVRYTMERAGFSVAAPFTFAEDISSDIMLKISEDTYYSNNGVTIDIASFREYSENTVAPHIIGNVGPIYAEEWETYKEKGYSYNDKVGKSGIEKVCEEQLRGTDGELTYYINSGGIIIDTEVTKEPVAGNSVRLTLDKTVQISAQQALASTIAEMNKDNIKVTAGAAVAVNVKTGGIIASANYPTYTYDDYINNYEKLSSDSAKPLFDRAFNGTYPPGSTFKPAVAVAALQTGVVTYDETIRCVGRYTYFKDYQPTCMHVHKNISLNTALSKSCNYYFFEVGRRLGITKMNEYCMAFGLGDYTGVEVNESKGVLAGPNSRAEWYEGYTIQAAIGQMDNAFTPLQLASYTATIANSGVRYKTTLIDKYVTYSQDKVVEQNEPVVLGKVNASEEVFDKVKEGMLSVTEDGTGNRIFSNYPIKVGGKTGTAQVTGKEDHTVFVAFAPYDDPEIAVAVIIEHGKYGTYSGSLLKSIFNSYFFTEQETDAETPAYELLP